MKILSGEEPVKRLARSSTSQLDVVEIRHKHEVTFKGSLISVHTRQWAGRVCCYGENMFIYTRSMWSV